MPSGFEASVDESLSPDSSTVENTNLMVDSSIEGLSENISSVALESEGGTHPPELSEVRGPGSLVRLDGSIAHLASLEPQQHSKLFYLSLIEGRCRTQAVQLLNEGRRPADNLPEQHPDVRALARVLFSEMSKELHKASILPDEFAGQDFEDLRTRYLNTFDTVLHSIAAKGTNSVLDPSTTGSHLNSHGLAINSGFSPFAMERKDKQRQLGSQRSLLSSLILKGSGGEHLPTSIFKTQYGPKSLLGKGGFGHVYRVKNLVDQREYAVKKIVIRGEQVSLARDKEQQEALLREARSLSKLNHENIVRYYGAWVETCPAGSSMDEESSGEP
jgi:translation initiation factor 2-alpha kinase 3